MQHLLKKSGVLWGSEAEPAKEERAELVADFAADAAEVGEDPAAVGLGAHVFDLVFEGEQEVDDALPYLGGEVT